MHVEGKVRVFPDAEGRRLLPSAVHYGEGEQVIVGQEALLASIDRPLDTIQSVKRFMGRGAREREETRGIAPPFCRRR
jgi:molecular chaperone HscA